MIQSLNAQSFREYGTVLPTRDRPPAHGNAHTLTLPPQQAVYYETVGDTWLGQAQGSVILSVSPCDDCFLDFYLDKPVRLYGGVRFRLVSLEGTATAQIAAAVMPRHLGIRAHTRDFALTPGLQVQSITTFFYQEKEQGFLFPGEAHPMWELTYVDAGQLHCVADGQDLLLGQGDMTLFRPGQWHMQYGDMGVGPRFVTVTFHITGGDLSGLCDRVLPASQEAARLLGQMLRAQDSAYSADRLLTLLQLLLLTLLESGGQGGTGLETSQKRNAENDIIRQAQQYIAANLEQKLSVPRVARHCQVSTSYLTALFGKLLKISPGEYVRRLKLQRSKQMIREGTLSFTEIAQALQYSTVQHFSRQFKEKFGITPTEYAKSVR